MKLNNLLIMALVAMPIGASAQTQLAPPALPAEALTLSEAVEASASGYVYIVNAKNHKFLRNHYIWQSEYSGDVYEALAPLPYPTGKQKDQARFKITLEDGHFYIFTDCGDLYLATREKNTKISAQDKYGVRVYADDDCKKAKKEANPAKFQWSIAEAAQAKTYTLTNTADSNTVAIRPVSDEVGLVLANDYEGTAPAAYYFVNSDDTLAATFSTGYNHYVAQYDLYSALLRAQPYADKLSSEMTAAQTVYADTASSDSAISAATATLLRATMLQLGDGDSIDVTPLISGYSFAPAASTDSWTSYSGWTSTAPMKVEYGVANSVNNAAFDLSQTLTDLPAGAYTVSTLAYNAGSGDPVIYANDTTASFRTRSVSSNDRLWGLASERSDARLSVAANVSDGTLKLGVKSTKSGYAPFSAFRLMYLKGTITPPEPKPDTTDADTIPAEYEGYKLVFDDEFSVEGRPDSNYWTFEHGFVRNHEDQYYQEDNAWVANGKLVIEGRKDSVKNERYREGSSDWKTSKEYASYTSASMRSRGATTGDYISAWQYGRFIVKAKLPCYTGCWPAIWTLGTEYEWPYNGEVDIMEYYPSGGNECLHANVAWGSSKRWNAQWASKTKKLSDLEENDPEWRDKYHVWRMDWDTAYIKLYCDDELLNSVDLDRTVNPSTAWFKHDNENPYRGHYQYLLLNLALGGDNGGSLAETPFPCQYLIDYVRIYQKIEEQPTGIGSVNDNGQAKFRAGGGKGQIDVAADGAANARVDVFNISGAQVYSGAVLLQRSSSSLPCTFPKGMYIVRISTPTQSVSAKVIVD